MQHQLMGIAMSKLLSRWATPLISGIFIVSLVSGAVIFFGVGRAYFTAMHEWLSMVLIVPFALHLWKNWRPFLNYFRRPAMIVSCAASLAAALAFAAPGALSSGRGAPPERVAIELVRTTSISRVAPLLGETPEELRAALESKGFTVSSTEQSIADIATASEKPASEALAAAIASRK